MRESKKIRLEEESKKSEKIVLSLIIAMVSLTIFVILKFSYFYSSQVIKWIFFGIFAFSLVRMRRISKR
jgi:hypothetical protein